MLAGLVFTIAGCEREDDGTLQDRIIDECAVGELSDDVYVFPANSSAGTPTVYLPLHKWDLMFFGDVHSDETSPNRWVSNVFIPGQYNHMMVYLGKDADGYAYAGELNIGDLRLENYTIVTTGHLRMLCLGTDHGAQTHVSGAYTLGTNYYGIRWAKSFIPQAHEQLMSRDREMVARLVSDLLAAYPYRLQFSISVLGFIAGDRTIQLVDDGFAGGSSCSEYWTGLFEEYGELCMENSRMNAADLVRYFRTSPEGRSAYLPAEFNPAGAGNLPVGHMIANGSLVLRNPPPHIYSCDGTTETGIVIPDSVMRSTLLLDPVPR